MVLTGQLQLGGVTSTSTADSVAAFIGPELRGVAGVTTTGLVYLTVYGDAAGEQISFKAFEASSNTVVDLVGHLRFVPACRQSSASRPYLLADAVPDGSNWLAPDESSFGERMNVTALLENAGSYQKLGAFVGAELRGLVAEVGGLGAPLYLDVFDEALTGDCTMVQFYTYADASGAEIATAQQLYFESGIVGTPSDPVALSQPGSITGTKFNDLDYDGVFDPSEPPLSGWTIELLDEFGQIVTTALTGADGSYRFAGLVAGTYFVREVKQESWARTVPVEETQQVTVATGQNVTGVDFGNTQSIATVSGVKYEDVAGDRTRDGGDNGLAGWTITAENDQGQIVSTAVTGSDGTYTLTLVQGTYTIAEVQQGGWVQTAPVGEVHAVALAVSDAVSGIDFGNSRTVGRLAGRKFNDRNGSGTRDGNEAGLADWVIEVLDAGSTVVATATTIDGGGYELLLSPGTYTVREVSQTGWVQAFPAAGMHAVTITAGVSTEGIDFGNTRDFGLARGLKFYDVDGNGQQDSGETGLPGWTIEAVDGTGAVAGTAVTGSDGRYAMLLPGGTYTVREVDQAGWAVTYPIGGTRTVAFTAGEEVTGIDFGNTTAVGTIAGLKFDDADGDALRGPGETGLAGWEITVANDQSVIVARDTTASDGTYGFTLPAGDYSIAETNQIGWAQTFPPGTGTHDVTLLPGDAIQGIDFGNTQAVGSIAGVKWNDRNGDGSRANNDKGLEGWTIEALGASGAVAGSATTDRSGIYTIADLAPGAYTVREQQQAGWAQTFPAGTGTHEVTLVSGLSVQGIDFGNTPSDTGTISGAKFNDADADSVRDGTEGGLAGWTIEVVDGSGQVVLATTTDADGSYAFTLSTGVYKLREVPKIGWLQTFPESGVHDVTLGAAATVTGVDFGNTQAIGILAGVKFNDRSGDGVRDEGEEGLAGWRIEVYDTETNPSRVAEATTGPDGSYRFVLPPDAYTLQEVQQPAWTQTLPDPDDDPAYSVSLTGGQKVEGLDFGNKADDATISGTAFDDADADSVRDGTEGGLEGWTIELVDGQEQVAGSAVTDDNGSYSIDVPPGTYVVREINQSGWIQTFPADTVYYIDVAAGENASGLDFGNTQAVGIIRGFKFNDRNGDGGRDEGEEGLEDWTIQAYDTHTSPSLVAEAYTVADGSYEIVLAPGPYAIREVQQTGWTQTLPDPIQDPDHTVAVTGGQILQNVDFGNRSSNEPPVVGDIVVSPTGPVAAGESVTASAAFADANPSDSHTAVWEWGDGQASEVTNATSPVSGTHAYQSDGLYVVTLTITDDGGESGSNTHSFVIVYEADGSSLTGSGSIEAPSGDAPSTPGNATFTASAKYQRNGTTPQGDVTFSFPAESVDFVSTTLDWLVINGTVAYTGGRGTNNGAGDLEFLLSASEAKGNSPDSLRMMIWDDGGVLYDTQPGDPIDRAPATGLQSGRINVAERGTEPQTSISAPVDSEKDTPDSYRLDQNYPNPFNPQTTITFGVSESVPVDLRVYDLLGQEVTRLVNGSCAAGLHRVVWDGRSAAGAPVPSGVYIYRMVAGSYVALRQMIMLK